MKTVRIIVESPDTGIVLVDVTVEERARATFFRQLARRFPYENIRPLGSEYSGCGNLVGRRVPIRAAA